jgi:hypothetical protein
MRIRARAVTVAGLLLVLGLLAPAALAANPHFIGTPTATQSGDTVTVRFKAAGLGNVEEADFTLTGDATVFSRCYTKSGNTPQAANKQETFTDITDAGTFPVRSGQTTGTLSISAPEPTLECPRGQRVVVESVTFDNVVLSGEGLTFTF